jgi:membrane protease YdiL (CAAX protease family)
MTTLDLTSAATPVERSAALRRAGLFLLVCAPIWLTPGVFSLAHPLLVVAVVVGLTLFLLRRDGRPAAVLGLDPSPRRIWELLTGLAGGVLLMGTIALAIGALLPFPWVRNPGFDPRLAAYSLLWLLCGNAVEELIFRGYGFERLITALGHWRAQLVTALLFAVFHIAQGWSWQVALTGTTIGSLLFGLVFVRWRSVPAAVGVHAAVNWTRDLLLMDPPIAKTLVAPLAPRPWTGQEQLLAGLAFSGVILLACWALWRSIRARSASPHDSGDLRADAISAPS